MSIFELDEELRLLQASSLRLARERFAARAAHWDRAAEPPVENLQPLAEAGLAGITIDPAYGGSGASILHAVVARMSRDLGFHLGQLQRSRAHPAVRHRRPQSPLPAPLGGRPDLGLLGHDGGRGRIGRRRTAHARRA
jgi:hypothetical protein